MKITRIALIGDIHYPESASQDSSIDRKDQTIPANVAGAIRTPKLHNAMRHLLATCEASHVATVLLCGDLTSFGKLDDYKKCVKYLSKALVRWPKNKIHVVPGNHDVDRALCKPNGTALWTKFRPLENVWKSRALPILPIKHIRQTRVDDVTIISLNSCIGCGEIRSLPKGVREKLFKSLKQHLRTGQKSQSKLTEAFSLVGEQLDTPAFLDDNITTIEDKVRHLSNEVVPIILSHHNILPQAVPRLDIYTEVINGGLIRSRLSKCQRPIIYCHGHIHDDPIEIVSHPENPLGRLISISAPAFDTGFNILEVIWSRGGRPVGCNVLRYRIAKDGSLKTERQVRASLVTVHDAALIDERAHAVLLKLTNEFIRFNELISSLPKSKRRAARSLVPETLLELEWMGVIEIRDRDEKSEFWQIRRVLP